MIRPRSLTPAYLVSRVNRHPSVRTKSRRPDLVRQSAFFLQKKIEKLAGLCRGQVKHPDVAIIVTYGRSATTRQGMRALAELERFGVQFVTDTCWCMITEPIITCAWGASRPKTENAVTSPNLKTASTPALTPSEGRSRCGDANSMDQNSSSALSAGLYRLTVRSRAKSVVAALNKV